MYEDKKLGAARAHRWAWAKGEWRIKVLSLVRRLHNVKESYRPNAHYTRASHEKQGKSGPIPDKSDNPGKSGKSIALNLIMPPRSKDTGTQGTADLRDLQDP